MFGLRTYATEVAGTFALTLAGTGAACMDVASGGRIGVIGIALAYGAATTAALYAFPGRPSRFNTALTAADLLARREELLRSILLLGTQLLGAACAGLFLRAVLAAGKPELLAAPTFLGACAPVGIGYRAATLVEAVLTFFLACTAAASLSRRRRSIAPIAVGATTLFGALVGGPLTGGAMNPARAFGPAIATGAWMFHYVYWVGPIAGATLAAFVAPYLVTEENLP